MSFYNSFSKYRHIEQQLDRLEWRLPRIYLKQEDFKNGTYRITQSGKYILSENITFNPNPSEWIDGKLVGDDWMPRSDQSNDYPISFHLGFFAAITIETNNVVVDLNEFTIKQSDEHYLQQRFFSVFELASSPFIKNQGPSNFGDIESSKYVKIKNGVIGKSSHSGIHGNGNQYVVIEDVSFNNFEQAAIALNGGKNILLKNVNVGKNSHDVLVRAYYSQSRFIRSFVQNIINKGNPEITILGEQKSGTDILEELIDEMNDTYEDIIIKKREPRSDLYYNPTGLIDGNIYGIIFNVLGVAVNDFLDKEGIGNENIYMDNVTICDLNSNPVEVIGLTKNLEIANDVSYGKDAQKGPVGDLFDIEKVMDEDHHYKPNVLANAQCYVSKYKDLIHSGSASVSPKIYDEWISTKIPLNDVIGDNYHYICGIDTMAHILKSNIALFLSGVKNASIENTHIKNINNIGEKAAEDKCDAKNIYNGNRTKGVACVESRNVCINRITIDGVKTKTGDSIGIDFINDNKYIKICNYDIRCIEQGTYLQGGVFPNTEPNAKIFNNKKSVERLYLKN